MVECRCGHRSAAPRRPNALPRRLYPRDGILARLGSWSRREAGIFLHQPPRAASGMAHAHGGGPLGAGRSTPRSTMKRISRKLTALQLCCAVLVVAVLYTLMDRQLSQRLTESFMAHGDVVTAALAKSVESPLVGRDLTSVQSALDAILSIPDVEWTYVTGPDGRVLAHTFVPKFPDALKEPSQGLKNRSLIMLPGEKQPSIVFQKPVLTGIVGTVHVGFSRASLVSSIHTME